MEIELYFASGISDLARKRYQRDIASQLRDMGYTLYAASENDSINDKSNNPTPLDIYVGDIEQVVKARLFLVCISGGNEDGTLSEIGAVAGWNHAIDVMINTLELTHTQISQLEAQKIKIIAYTTNERLMQPQFWNGIASGGVNHLVAGMIDKWGIFVGGEQDMLKYMRELKGVIDDSDYNVEFEPGEVLYYLIDDDRRARVVDLGWCFMLIDDYYGEGMGFLRSNDLDELLRFAYNEWGLELIPA